MTPDFTQLSHRITIEKARHMIGRFKDQKEKILKNEHAGKNILPVCETFNRQAIDKLLTQPGCIGVRIYYSMDEALRVHAILVGVNSNNEDILPKTASATTSEARVTFSLDNTTTPGTDNDQGEDDDEEDNEVLIVEDGVGCPPSCPPSSPLNT